MISIIDFGALCPSMGMRLGAVLAMFLLAYIISFCKVAFRTRKTIQLENGRTAEIELGGIHIV